MEKEAVQPDSLAAVTIKPDYAPSEAFSSEPPPAYQRPKSASVQVAKIISFTVIAVTVLLGCFLLASAYVTANASCKQLEQELAFLSETADRLQPLQPEALIQEEQHANKVQVETIQPEVHSTPVKVQEITENNVPQDSSDNSDDNVDNSSDDSSDDEEKTIHIKMPLELDFDDLAGALMEKNQRSRMNCIVEKKRAEQVVDHQPKTIQLPFGLNLTTDPRYEHVSGERMAIFCESGNEQRQQEPEEQEDTIMIQPVMIPIPPQNFHTHMAMQAQSQQMPNRIPQSAMPLPQPMETLRPPMPASEQQTPPGFPPHQILQHIAQQIIAQKLQMEAERNHEEQQTNDISEPEQQHINQQYSPHGFMMAHRIPIAEDVLTQINRLPNRDMFIAVSQRDPMGHPREIQIPQRENAQSEETQDYSRELPVNLPVRVMQIHPEIQAPGAIEMRPQAASEQDSMDSEVHIMQQQRDTEQDVTDRQIYSRDLPTNMPIRIMQLQQDTQAAASEEMRPHYLHPRSVRSVDNILPKSVTSKRVKRCSCDCAC